MSISIRRIGAIFTKELQDIRTNMNVLCMYPLPLLILVIFKQFIKDFPSSWLLGLSLVMLVGEVCVIVPAMLIAEEREKKTLGALMLSPATPFEVFTGKGLLTFVTTMLTALVVILLSGSGLQHLDVILTGTALATLACILLGMMVGLLAQNQMATGVLSLPIALPFIMLPYITIMGDEVMQKIASITPTYHLFMMISLGIGQDKGLGDMLPFIGALVGSILVTFAILLMVYRKRGLE